MKGTMMLKRMSLMAALVFSTAAVSQQRLPSTNVSSTIAVTDTFQEVFGSGPKAGCSIQNKGAASMWVFFGPIASATKAKSIELTNGQSVTCGVAGVVVSDQISITGTATQEFFAAVQ